MKNLFSKRTYSRLGAVIFIVIVIISLTAIQRKNKDSSNIILETKSESENNVAEFSLDMWKAVQEYTIEKDSKLVLINRITNERKELIPSLNLFIKNTYPLIAFPRLLGDTNTGQEIYLCMNTEYGCAEYFAININTLNIRNIKNTGDVGRVLAPTGDMAIVLDTVNLPANTPDGSLNNSIDLACFTHDTKIKLITLAKGEVFNEYFRELDDHTYIKWLDQKTIEFNVYAQANSPQDKNIFLRKQIITIPSCS
jgi:hypothetical protein